MTFRATRSRALSSQTAVEKNYQIVFREGEPFVEIIRRARKDSVDLIVMGTHGRTGLDHVLFGSTAEKVVRKSPCPVLTVRLPGRRFSMP